MRLILAIMVLATSTSMVSAQQNYFEQPTYDYQLMIDQVVIENPEVEPLQHVKTAKASQPKTYKEAYHDAQNGDKPLLVLVTADWCPPCQQMKRTTIPQLMQKDAFKDFHYATVDFDQETSLARQLIGDRGLPQIIMFEQQDGQWVRRYLKGIQNLKTVEAFFSQAQHFRTADADQKTGEIREK